MNEITKVILENEMDLILAHKQSMRIGELAGLSLPGQTTFATAVAEVCRIAIAEHNAASLIIYISDKKEKIKYITAILDDSRANFPMANEEGYKYAQKLVHHIKVEHTATGTHTTISYRLPASVRVDDTLVEKWRINLNTDPALSPYEEIKRKNKQLQELTEKLRESEQRYKSLTDSLPIMIFSVTGDCEIIFANNWVAEYTGRSVKQINQSQWEDILHPEDMQTSCVVLREKIHQQEKYITTELRFRNGENGEYRWHTGVFIAIPDDNGAILHWNTYMVDIEAQKQVEQTLKDNKELKDIKSKLEEKVLQLHQSNMQLAQFAYVASHDLQEPLRKIAFYSDMLQSRFGSVMPAEATPFFNSLIGATRRMKMLIQDVLKYSTVQKTDFAKVDLNKIITEALSDLEILIQEKQAEIIADRLPEIDGNASQLQQVFENLISNSLKFSRPGVKPVVTIKGNQENGMLQITLADNGIGFDEKYAAKMFDLFQKLHNNDTYKGTGIGLAICKKVIELHNGTIHAEGEHGKGSTFTITLPVKQTD